MMPVYNGAKFVGNAIKSILNQSYKDFEFVIVDDGSTDNTVDVINQFKDKRIKLIRNQHLGLQKTLNIGLKESNGLYIARMDADDESLPERLKLQKEFLDNNPLISCVGTRIIAVFDDKNVSKISWRPKTPVATKFISLFETPIFHPTAMCRSEIIKRYGYNESLPRSEDYDIWSRMLADGLKITNLHQPLLTYKIHKESFTKKAGKTNLDTVSNITLQNMQRYTKLSEQEIDTVKKYRSGYPLSLDQWFIFFILCLKLFFEFYRKETVNLKEAPTLLRIVASLIFRTAKRSIFG